MTGPELVGAVVLIAIVALITASQLGHGRAPTSKEDES